MSLDESRVDLSQPWWTLALAAASGVSAVWLARRLARGFTLDPTTGTLEFGDGEEGARLPSGAQNVRSTYRSGAGATGKVSDTHVEGLESGGGASRRGCWCRPWMMPLTGRPRS
jgi:hypothetical protein